MDLGDITQLALVATTVFVLGRVGWAFARLIERRASAHPTLPAEATERLRDLEDEQLTLRQQLEELQERQDFTERVLARDERAEMRPLPAEAPSERLITPR
jgi:hypothetical protein